MVNDDAYKTRSLVEFYSQLTDLQRPEESILNALLPDISRMVMLDVGVGGGRTTLHFAKWVNQYVGIDYSKEMIAACQQRFSPYPRHISFKVGDARSLRMFDENTFDFVLFSFNGIDSVSHTERLLIFEEIQRIGKPGGIFCFSTHNLQSIDKKFDLKHQFSRNPERLVRKITRWFSVRFVYNRHVNTKQLKKSQYAIINDGAHHYQLKLYYIKPAAQIEQLAECFKNIQVYSLVSGAKVYEEAELRCIDDDWLYYSCIIR